MTAETVRLALVGHIVGIAKAGAPVAEVRGDDENRCGIREVGCEDVAKFTLGGGRGVADEDGDERWERGWGREVG